MRKKIKTLLRQAKELRTSGYKRVFIYYIMQAISVAVISYLTVVFSKTVIELFMIDKIKEVFMYSFVYTILLSLAIFLKIYSQTMASHVFLTIRINQFERYYEKYLKIDYIKLEDANFQKEIEPSLNALGSDEYGFQYTYTLSFQLVSLLIGTIVYMSVLSQFNYLIILACLFGMVINYFIYRTISKIQYKEKNNLAVKRRKTKYFYNMTYDFSYGKDIRLYNLEDHLIKSYQDESKGLLNILKRIKRKSMFLNLIDVLSIIVRNGLSYYLIITAFFNNQIDISVVMMLFTTSTLLSESLNETGIKLGRLNEHLRYTMDYYDYIDSKEIIYQKANDMSILENITIELIDVGFRYPNAEAFILRNINLKIDRNSKVAIVGKNGAGKTTLIKLICGLLRPTEGKILLNGIDSSLFSQETYYKMFGMVFQDTTAFSGTILENVMGTYKDNIELAKKALEKVGLKNKIESYKLGYEQPLLKVIHENGIELSGGEKQKLNIARSLYKDAPVVILDEPTASLDALAEEKIYLDFNEVSKDKTSIFISHRLSSTKFCDKIILLTKEGIKEEGSHDELINKKGLYYDMFTVQGKYYQEEFI